MTRKLLWPVLAIGIALIVAPFVISLPSRASDGQKMINDFHPIMQPASVAKTADYYNNTFVKLRPVAVAGVQAANESPAMMQALAKQMHMTPLQLQAMLKQNFPAMAALLGNLPQLTPVFQQVPPGLDHYLPLVQTMQANVDNYKSIDGLPDFTLFTWFFVIPGALLILISAYGLGAFEVLRLHVPHRHVPSH